jgi:FMN-dependent NADH-azoreductase
MDADVLVIGAPMYNFGISSVPKAWFAHIARAGITFKYTAEVPVGLITGKKAYIAVTTGGVYSSGEAVAYDYLSKELATKPIPLDHPPFVESEANALPTLHCFNCHYLFFK